MVISKYRWVAQGCAMPSHAHIEPGTTNTTAAHRTRLLTVSAMILLALAVGGCAAKRERVTLCTETQAVEAGK